MKSKTKVLKKPEKAIKELEKLGSLLKGPNSVKVGLPKGSNPYPDGTSVIMVGVVQEFGSPSMGVPARSYLRSTVVERSGEYKQMMKKLATKVISGDLSTDEALDLLGIKVQGDVQMKIETISLPPLKHREGNPLIDTGHLRQSITYQVGE